MQKNVFIQYKLVYYSTSKNSKCQNTNIIKTPHFSVYHVTADYLGKCAFNLWNNRKNVSGYLRNHVAPSGERDTASSRGCYGEKYTHATMLRGVQAKHKGEY